MNSKERIEKEEREERELKEAKERHQRELREAQEREAIRYHKYRESIHQMELAKHRSELQQKVKKLGVNRQLPDWVRSDVLETAINYMRNGEEYLVSEKYRKLIKEFGL